MSQSPDKNNPYASPATDADWLTMRRRAIQVGTEELHTIIVESSIWTGLSTHTVNAAGDATPARRGPCRFDVGKQEVHHVEIEVDKTSRVNAYVDGEQVEVNLFPQMRSTIAIGVAALVLAMIVLAGVIVYVVAGKLP